MSIWGEEWWLGIHLEQLGVMTDSDTINKLEEVMDYMLTYLETLESQHMLYGLYDSMISGNDWLSFFIKKSDEKQVEGFYTAAIYSLWKLGWVLSFDCEKPLLDRHFRSKAAEVARLLNKLRQRFGYQRYVYQSKSLVGNVKFEVRPRIVPRRDIELGRMLEPIEGHEWVFKILKDMLIDRDKYGTGKSFNISGFQLRAFRVIVDNFLKKDETRGAKGIVITAGTGSGKTLAFFIPALFQLLVEKYDENLKGVKILALYPRTRLANNQLQELVDLIGRLNKLLTELGKEPVTIGVESMYTPTAYKVKKALLGEGKIREWKPIQWRGETALVCPWMPSPCCEKKDLILRQNSSENSVLCCSQCLREFPFLKVTKEQLKENPPDILLGVTESINRRLMASDFQKWFGLGEDYTAPTTVMLDEIHLQSSISGMQTGYLMRRLIHRLSAHRSKHGPARPIQVAGLSATIGEPIRFFNELTGIWESRIQLVSPLEAEMCTQGAEYYYFNQANRRGEASLLACLIQSAMCLIHNTHPSLQRKGSYKAFGFLNSRDLVYRWEKDMGDAENSQRPPLYSLRAPQFIQGKMGKQYLGILPLNCKDCKECPDLSCQFFKEGECWWLMHYGGGLNSPMRMTTVTSLGGTSLENIDLAMATSSLEVGYDDPYLMTVIQHLAPTNIASFVQRKGRGGRQAGSRPVMLTVLSPFSSRDQFYFNNTHILTDPVFQKMPLNPNNYLVQRVHGFFAIMDYLAYRAANEGRPFDPGRLSKAMVSFVMGATETRQMQGSLKEYLERALRLSHQSINPILSEADGIIRYGLPTFVKRSLQLLINNQNTSMQEIMKDYVPENLFSDINLPEVTVEFNNKKNNINKEKIEMALQEALPGRVTFRWEVALWIVPNGNMGDGGNPDIRYMNLMSFIEPFPNQANPKKIPMKKLPLPQQKILDFGIGGSNLKVYQPQAIKYEHFYNFENQGGMKGNWLFDESTEQFYWTENVSGKSMAIDRRSETYGLASYHLSWSKYNTNDSLRMKGLLDGAVLRLKFAENSPGSDYLNVTKIFVGCKLSLQYGDQKKFDRVIAYKDNEGHPACLGYEMQTEAIAFIFNEEAFACDYSAEILNLIRWKTFYHEVLSRCEVELRISSRTAELFLMVLGLSAALRDIQQCSPLDLINSYDEGHFIQVANENLQRAEYIRDDLISLIGRIEFFEIIKSIAVEVESRPQGALVRDPLLHTLKHVMKKAAQSVTGVETQGELAAYTFLASQDGQGTKAEITLFELGMKGTGVLKVLRQILSQMPETFWDQVERGIFHCEQGDEEILLRELLNLSESQLKAIADHVGEIIDQASMFKRNKAIEMLVDYLRNNYGFVLQPNMMRVMRIIFAKPADLIDHRGKIAEVNNWQLFRELYHFINNVENKVGRKLEPELLAELFQIALEKNPSSFPNWSVMKDFITYQAEQDAVEIETIKKNVNDPRKYLYKTVFQSMGREELEKLISMSAQECKNNLVSTWQVEPGHVNDFYKSAFAQENGYCTAFLYWDFVHGKVDEKSLEAIRDQARYRLRESIQMRLLQTCTDGCPSCLYTLCELEPPWAAPYSLSQKLAREFVINLWKMEKSLIDIRGEDTLTEKQLIRKIRNFFRTGSHLQVRLWHRLDQVEMLHKSISKLIASGIKGPSGRSSNIKISGLHTRDFNLCKGITWELVLTLQ